MPVSNHYLNQTLYHLSQVVPVGYRRIFTGAGVYHQNNLFAVITDNKLYFRVDEHSVAPYRERAMPVLRPRTAQRADSHFYQLPEDVLHCPAELLHWMRAAMQASQATLSSTSSAPPLVDQQASSAQLLAR